MFYEIYCESKDGANESVVIKGNNIFEDTDEKIKKWLLDGIEKGYPLLSIKPSYIAITTMPDLDGGYYLYPTYEHYLPMCREQDVAPMSKAKRRQMALLEMRAYFIRNDKDFISKKRVNAILKHYELRW